MGSQFRRVSVICPLQVHVSAILLQSVQNRDSKVLDTEIKICHPLARYTGFLRLEVELTWQNTSTWVSVPESIFLLENFRLAIFILMFVQLMEICPRADVLKGAKRLNWPKA